MSKFTRQKFSLRMLSCIIAVCMCVTMFAGTAAVLTSAEEAGYTVWSGGSYDSLSALITALGDADDEGYYHITTAEQLHGAIANNGGGYKFRLDNDLYLNSGYENYLTWGSNAPANVWDFTGHASNVPNYRFYGTIDGCGHTVYGLYSGSGYYAGLIGGIDGFNPTTIKNLNVEYAYIRASKFGGAIAGGNYYQSGNDTTITFDGCSVNNVYFFNIWNRGATGGIIGVSSVNVKISNSSVTGVTFKSGAGDTDFNGLSCMGSFIGGLYKNMQASPFAFDAAQAKSLVISNSFAVDNKIENKAGTIVNPAYVSGLYDDNNTTWSYSLVAENVYTDSTNITTNYAGTVKLMVSADGQTAVESTSADYPIRTVAAEDLIGAAAKAAMPLLDWNSWATVPGGYPVYTGIEIWDGTDTFATTEELYASMAGEGTEASPYMIKTANQLHAAIRFGGENKYYKLANNLYLNENWEEYDTWTNNSGPANNWGLSGTGYSFSGTIDGDNHAIYGYYNSASQYAGLIPVVNYNAGDQEIVTIKNLDMLYCHQNANTASGFFVGASNNRDNNGGNGSVTIEGCTIQYGRLYLIWGGNSTGGFVGLAGGNSPVTIKDCAITDIYFDTRSEDSAAGYSFCGSFVGGTNSNLSIEYDVFSSGQASCAKIYNSYAYNCKNKQGNDVYICGLFYKGMDNVTGLKFYSFCVTAKGVYTDATAVPTSLDGTVALLVSEDGISEDNTVQAPTADNYAGLFESGAWYMGEFGINKPILKSRTAQYTYLDITGDGVEDMYSISDLAALRKHLLGVKEYAYILGDVDNDTANTINIIDLIRLKKILAGK